MADEDIWADNWNQDEWGGVDSQEDYLTYGATDYYQRAFDPDARGASYAALGPTQQEGPREGQQKNLQSFTIEAAGEPVTPQDSEPGGGQPLTTVPVQYLGSPESIDIMTEGAGLTRSQSIFQTAVERAASTLKDFSERAAGVFSRSRGG